MSNCGLIDHGLIGNGPTARDYNDFQTSTANNNKNDDLLKDYPESFLD